MEFEFSKFQKGGDPRKLCLALPARNGRDFMMLNRQASILIVEDDADIRTMMHRRLELEGYAVQSLEYARDVMPKLARAPHDLVVLDLNLPDGDGMELCQDIRNASDIPIIVVTARGTADDTVRGLERGADDYLAKPFEPREFLARIRTVLRRTRPQPARLRSLPRTIGFDDWQLDVERRAVMSPAGRLVMLSAVEFRLLLVFLQHAGQDMKREILLDLMGEPGALDRAVDLQVSRLRNKLKTSQPGHSFIQTVRHVGYRFDAKVDTR
ncbi:MAG: response regulator transcription factor [Hyphomonadaceae bacterium]|nr:response regulator transcription factor [Hyphomonadaceae bacterium]